MIHYRYLHMDTLSLHFGHVIYMGFLFIIIQQVPEGA